MEHLIFINKVENVNRYLNCNFKELGTHQLYYEDISPNIYMYQSDSLLKILDDYFDNYDLITPNKLLTFYNEYKVSIDVQLEDEIGHEIHITKEGFLQPRNADEIYPNFKNSWVFCKNNDLLDDNGYPISDITILIEYDNEVDLKDSKEYSWLFK